MKKRTPKAKASARRLSRPLLDQMLRDLTERIEKQVLIAQAIYDTNKPYDDHMMAIEHRLRTVFGLQLECHLRGLRDVRGLAKLLCERHTTTGSRPVAGRPGRFWEGMAVQS